MAHRVEGAAAEDAEEATALLTRRKAAVCGYVAHWSSTTRTLRVAEVEESTKAMAHTAAGAYGFHPSVVAISARFFKLTQRLHLQVINDKRAPGEQLELPAGGIVTLPGRRVEKDVRLGSLRKPPRLSALRYSTHYLHFFVLFAAWSRATCALTSKGATGVHCARVSDDRGSAAYCQLMRDLGAVLQHVFSGESAGALVLPHHHDLVVRSTAKLDSIELQDSNRVQSNAR